MIVKNNIKYFLILLLASGTLFWACEDKKDDKPEAKTGKIKLKFTHLVDGKDVEFETLKYTNKAGNKYKVSEVQYFISDITLYKKDGQKKIIKDWQDIYYVDTDIPRTLTWEVPDNIDADEYNKISFVLGFTEEKNKSYMFVNYPEMNMFWPEHLGGGFHYLKLNGFWEVKKDSILPYNFHLGRGQIRDKNDSITGFEPNFFYVNLNKDFKIEKDKTTDIEIIMNIEKWFENPNEYDFNYWGGSTMENRESMQKIKENGNDVFSIK